MMRIPVDYWIKYSFSRVTPNMRGVDVLKETISEILNSDIEIYGVFVDDETNGSHWKLKRLIDPERLEFWLPKIAFYAFEFRFKSCEQELLFVLKYK